jgi:hypothetical protein
VIDRKYHRDRKVHAHVRHANPLRFGLGAGEPIDQAWNRRQECATGLALSNPLRCVLTTAESAIHQASAARQDRPIRVTLSCARHRPRR